MANNHFISELNKLFNYKIIAHKNLHPDFQASQVNMLIGKKKRSTKH